MNVVIAKYDTHIVRVILDYGTDGDLKNRYTRKEQFMLFDLFKTFD